MITGPEQVKKIKQLNELSMLYETAVIVLPADHYLEEFYDFYRIRNRQPKLILSEDGFYETLKNVSGDDCWKPIADKTESLFGLPIRITVFEDNTDLREELGGSRGLSSFFFVFDLMFCEYKDFTLCFLSGSNN